MHNVDMGHLIRPLDGVLPIRQFTVELREVHDAVAERARNWPLATFPIPDWGTSAKRASVLVANLHPWIEALEQPMSELMNQLATIERMFSALVWLANNGAENIVACHPTTSSGDHDLVAAGPGAQLFVFEVSDVAGGTGNQNEKITKDLKNLIPCVCEHCRSEGRKFLAVSPLSGAWLERLGRSRNRLSAKGLASVDIIESPGDGTWIVELLSS